jgi:hypothetical protein
MTTPRNMLAVIAALSVPLLDACIAESGAPYEDEPAWSTGQPLTQDTLLKDTALYTSSGEATMYQWAERTAPVIRVMPEQAVVRVANPQNKNGYFQVIHAGTWGWIHRAVRTQRHGPIKELSRTRVDALRLAQSAMGFSYWWSNARWVATGPTILPVRNEGDCDGNCPKCTHKATGAVEYGSDCSGFVSTVWGLPTDNDPDTNPDSNGYGTKAYAKANKRGSTIDLEDAITGYAVVRHDDEKQHIFLVGAAMDEDGWIPTYECVGSEAGWRTKRRRHTNLDTWTAIRRSGWPED